MKYDEKAYDQLRVGLAIDKASLDEEAIRQPNDFFHASEGYAIAVSRRDGRKHELEITIAQIDRDIRDNADSEGEKLTEALIRNRVTSDSEHQRAYHEYLDACLVADRWQALQNAYRQRADMLRSLIQMYLTGHFGEVTGSAERTGARERFNEGRRG